jgi:hypothetical protein
MTDTQQVLNVKENQDARTASPGGQAISWR